MDKQEKHTHYQYHSNKKMLLMQVMIPRYADVNEEQGYMLYMYTNI